METVVKRDSNILFSYVLPSRQTKLAFAGKLIDFVERLSSTPQFSGLLLFSVAFYGWRSASFCIYESDDTESWVSIKLLEDDLKIYGYKVEWNGDRIAEVINDYIGQHGLDLGLVARWEDVTEMSSGRLAGVLYIEKERSKEEKM